MNSYSIGTSVPASIDFYSPQNSKLPDFEDVLKSFSKFCKNIAYHYGRFYDEHQRSDLLQEANIALWNAYKKFDASIGAPFEHYAKSAISNNLKKALAALQAEKTEYLQFTLDSEDTSQLGDYFDTLASDPERHLFTDPEFFAGRSEVESRVESIKQTLPHKQQLILEKIFNEGMSVSEVARELGVSHQTISKQYRQIEALIYENVAELLH